MANISNSMDSVFDDGLDFDTIFDREDRLIDTVEGVKEEDMDWFDEADAAIVSGDVGHIPGEPDTDNGPGGHEGTTRRLAKTDSEGREYPGSAEHQAYSDSDSPGSFKKALGYREGADPDEYLADDDYGVEDECKESVDLDDELLDESFLDPDEYLLDESSIDGSLDDGVDWFNEEFDNVDDALINSVDKDNSSGSGGLDYVPGSDDELLDELI